MRSSQVAGLCLREHDNERNITADLKERYRFLAERPLVSAGYMRQGRGMTLHEASPVEAYIRLPVCLKGKKVGLWWFGTDSFLGVEGVTLRKSPNFKRKHVTTVEARRMNMEEELRETSGKSFSTEEKAKKKKGSH